MIGLATVAAGGGGGMVPTTGEDIMGGTMGITEAGSSGAGTGLRLTGSCGTGPEGGGSMGILCKYPYPIPHPRLPSPPHAPLGVIITWNINPMQMLIK